MPIGGTRKEGGEREKGEERTMRQRRGGIPEDRADLFVLSVASNGEYIVDDVFVLLRA